MAQRAEPAQDGRDQPAHQRAIAVRQRLQSGMRRRSVELVVEHAPLVQHAVEDISRNPARGEGQEPRWAERIARASCAANINSGQGRGTAEAVAAGRPLVTCEYAEYKNGPCHFTGPVPPIICLRGAPIAKRSEISNDDGQQQAGVFVFWETGSSSAVRKPLSPAAQRARWPRPKNGAPKRSTIPMRSPGSCRGRKAWSRPATATGSTRASPRISRRASGQGDPEVSPELYDVRVSVAACCLASGP